MGQNNKKYLDYAGLEKLVDIHAVVPHPQVEITEEGAYKIAFDEHGHITSKSALTAADLGLDNALHFIGVSTTDPLSATGATVAEHTGAFKAGDVVLYKRTAAAGDNGQGNHYDDDTTSGTTELYFEEYIYTGTAWELLGDASSYALKEVTVTGDGTYITGGGDLSANRKLSHKTYTAAAAAIKAVGRDAGGHVVLGNEITVQSGGGSTHDHTTSTTIAANTYVTEVTDTHTKLSVTPTTAKVLKTIPGAFGNLDTTTIYGISGNTKASKATAGTAVAVAKAGEAVVYGTADVGTAVSVAKQATAQTKVGNADVDEAVVYGTANVGTAITVDAGKADVGTAVTGLAKRATAATVYGTANVGTGTTVASGTVTSVSKPTVTVTPTANTNAYNADVENETLILTPATLNVTATATATAPTVTLGKTTIYEAVEAPNTQKLWAVQETTTSVTPAIASNRTVSFTPATAAPSTQTLTPAKAVSDSSTKIYGVSGSVEITPAVAAPTDQTIIPAVANGTITPYTFSDVTVPKQASAITVATGSVSVGGSGAAIMTGLGTVVEEDVMTDATIVAGTTGDVDVVNEVTAAKNTAKTFTGTTDEHTCPAHTHTLTTA